MYRILIADDEGIMLESLKTLIQKNFPLECEIECVKTGRAAVEAAERFKPDIAFLDIQMPGLNGIQAMQEIRKYNNYTLFIIVTAFDRFSFAKEAINLGVIDYLTKPVNHKVIVDVLMRAMKIIDENRLKVSDDRKVRERMAAVIPIIESGFVFSILLQDDFSGRSEMYKELLDIREDYGQVLVVEWGDEERDGQLSNPVGAGVKAFAQESVFRGFLRESFDAVPGPIICNRIIAYLARSENSSDEQERSLVIAKALHTIRRMKAVLDFRYRIGFGSVHPFSNANESYKEALTALYECGRTVCHFDDYSAGLEPERIIADAKEYIRGNICRDITIDNIANAVGVSSYYFARLFKERTGERLIEHITNTRLEAAAQLLRDTNNSVEEVCSSCGYMDANYFERIFSKKYGVTPIVYRGGKC